MRLPPLSYNEFVQRGVSPTVARFITAERHPIPTFDIFVRPVFEPWEYNVPADATDVIGLWDENADVYARWTRSGQEEFVYLCHDDAEHDLIAWTEQGLLAHLARSYFELVSLKDQGTALQNYEAFTEYIGFRHAAELAAYMLADSEESSDGVTDFRSRFGRLP